MIFLIFLLIFSLSIYWSCLLIYSVIYRIKVNRLLESIDNLEDLLFMNYSLLLSLTAEMFRRKGHLVKITDKCGEEGKGLILDNIKFVQIWRRAIHHDVECETAIKLARCMQYNSVYRGMLITLGDFKQNTKAFCHKNVIECVNGRQLLSMFREVQKRRICPDKQYEPTCTDNKTS